MHAQAFRKHRKSMGLTQAQMASLLRLPLGALKKLEAGTLDPPTSKKLLQKHHGLKGGRDSVTGSGG
jgi:predicted transcriptional regulator